MDTQPTKLYAVLHVTVLSNNTTYAEMWQSDLDEEKTNVPQRSALKMRKVRTKNMRNVMYVLHWPMVEATVTGTGNECRLLRGAGLHSY